MSALRHTCLLFTKHFPFGIHENYLFNEIPHLTEGFRRVVIIPVDEHDYKPSDNRLTPTPGVEILEINRLPAGSVSRLKREQAVISSFFGEWKQSRERAMVMRRRKTLAAILRHLYRSGHALAGWIRSQGLTPENAVCYHYWFHNGLVITWLMETWANGIHLPQIARAHSGDLYHRDWNTIQRTQGIHVPFEQVKWRQADRVMTISDHGYRFVQEVFPQHIHKTAVARLGVMDHGCEVRTMNRDAFVIVSCSLLSANKRLNRLPEILEHVQMPVRWVHFGEGSEADREAIRRDIAARCPHVTVDFRGLVRNPEIIAFYQTNAVDLIVNLSFAEGIPVALMEAASFGVPMLATATVGSPEICNNENGILIPVEFDPAEVGRSIQGLMNEPQRWEEKSRAARATFEKHYNAASNYSAFTRMLQSFDE